MDFSIPNIGIGGGTVLLIAIVVGRILFGILRRRFLPSDGEAEGQPGVVEAVAAFKRKNWDRLVEIYTDRSPPDRYHFLEGLGQLTKLDGPVPPNPKGQLAIIVAGVFVGWAWRHRGGGLGSSVNERAGMNMFRRLSLALELIDGLGDEMDSVACALGIRAEMGLSGDRAVLQRFLNRAASLSEKNLFVARTHLSFVAPKWHGSVEEMETAARNYASATNNPAWLSLVAYAHAESMLYRLTMNDDMADRAAASRYYFETESFGMQLEQLDDDFWKMRDRGDVRLGLAEAGFAHNYMAYVLYRRGLMSRSARHLDRVGEDLFMIPWAYVGMDKESLPQLRATVGLGSA